MDFDGPDARGIPYAPDKCLGPDVLRLENRGKGEVDVVLTGQRLGSVGRHLKVLLDARLVQRRRAGRSVLYCRTAAGTVLVGAQRDG
ncbi:MAG TPA: hypothetical protein VMV92_05920 [Streptosporangiaceae bacterium]|nr:hypothetical protein [Streptosporangiaceae bacterium]